MDKELEIGDFVVFTKLDLPKRIYTKGPEINVVYQYKGSRWYEDDEHYSGTYFIHSFVNTKTLEEVEFWLRIPEFTQTVRRQYEKFRETEISKTLYIQTDAS